MYLRSKLLIPCPPTVPKTRADKGSSADYRANFEPAEKHFDHKHADEVDPPWKDNPRRFLLIGRPQIGKTGVFLWLVWLLWQRLNSSSTDAELAEAMIDVDDVEDVADDDQEVEAVGGSKYPTLDLVSKQNFQHPPKEIGGYGDLRDPGMWKHYMGRYEAGGASPLPKPPPYKPGQGFKARAEVSSAPSSSRPTGEATFETRAAGSKRTAECETANK